MADMNSKVLKINTLDMAYGDVERLIERGREEQLNATSPKQLSQTAQRGAELWLFASETGYRGCILVR